MTILHLLQSHRWKAVTQLLYVYHVTQICICFCWTWCETSQRSSWRTHIVMLLNCTLWDLIIFQPPGLHFVIERIPPSTEKLDHKLWEWMLKAFTKMLVFIQHENNDGQFTVETKDSRSPLSCDQNNSFCFYKTRIGGRQPIEIFRTITGRSNAGKNKRRKSLFLEWKLLRGVRGGLYVGVDQYQQPSEQHICGQSALLVPQHTSAKHDPRLRLVKIPHESAN